MDVLIVFAHPEPASFGAALKNEAVAALTAAGHAVTVSDLYAMDWTPALGPDEFAHDRSNADFLGLSREQERAHRHGSHAADVRAEQAKVATADLVLFHFPMRLSAQHTSWRIAGGSPRWTPPSRCSSIRGTTTTRASGSSRVSSRGRACSGIRGAEAAARHGLTAGGALQAANSGVASIVFNAAHGTVIGPGLQA